MWIMEHYRHWRYKNTTLLLASIAIFIFFADTPFIKSAISHLGEWGYVGAVLAGICSVLTFTVAPALVVLYYLAERLNIFELAVLAGLGSVIGDFLIFSFFKDKVFVELEPIVTRLSQKPFMHIFQSPYFAWLTPVAGALIIASPLPDELGVTLLSASKLKRWHFILLSFTLNTIGVWILINGARLIFD